MTQPTTGRNWWHDHFARLVITIIGGVVAAVIVAFLIPALQDSGSDSPEDPTETPTGEEQAPPQEEAPTDDGAGATEPQPADGG